MKNQQLTIHQKRLEALYERELRRIVDQLSRRKELPSLPISYCRVDKNLQTLRIHIAFLAEEEKKLLELLNKRYASLVARMLASTRRFPRIPHLFFLPDKELEQINRLEELVKNN